MYKSKKKKKNETKNYIPHTKRKRNIIPSKTSKNSMFFSIQKKKSRKQRLFVCLHLPKCVYSVYNVYRVLLFLYFQCALGSCSPMFALYFLFIVFLCLDAIVAFYTTTFSVKLYFHFILDTIFISISYYVA